ncbi:MAG: MFS transporter, partial [Alphaproteobacteria bacterium]|nr:MFS transporter [Alphaproteobacteria bacterium]
MKEYNFWTWLPSLNFVRGLSFVTLAFITLIMYKQMGLSNSEITFYTSWLYLPYILKPLLRFFMKLWKSCRWWIVTLELLIGASFGGVAFMIPTSFWLQGTMFFFWLMAFASATHDIAIDEFYLLEIDKYNKAWFVGIRYTFYRLATIFGQGILVMIAGNLQVIYRNSISYSWSLMFYGITGIFIALWLLHHYALPTSYEDILRKDVNVNTIWQEFLNTIKTFLKNEQMKAGVLFMFLFLMPEGLLAKVSALFLIDAAHNGGMGLSPQEYGLVQGTVGVIGLTLGG